MEVFLQLNGFEVVASVDEQEQLMLGLASGSVPRDELTGWLRGHLAPLRTN
jgi:death-on-curing protein